MAVDRYRLATYILIASLTIFLLVALRTRNNCLKSLSVDDTISTIDNNAKLPLMDIPYKSSNATLEPHVCLVVRTWHQHKLGLLALISSVLSSGYTNVSFHLLDTQGDFYTLPEYIETINLIYGRKVVEASPITYNETILRYPVKLEFEDFGYIQTDLHIIDAILNNKSSVCEYIVVTNGDKLYGAQYLPALQPQMLEKKDVLLVEYVCHYNYVAEGFLAFIGHLGQDVCIFSGWGSYMHDLGAAIFRTEHWRNHNHTFIVDLMRIDMAFAQKYAYERDQDMIRYLADAAKDNKFIIPRTLFFHQ